MFYFMVYFIFCLYFNFEFLITSTRLNSIRWIVLLHRIIMKNTETKLNNNPAYVEQPGKVAFMEKNHLTTVRSHLRWANIWEHVYMRPEVNSNRFEISNLFEKSFRLHGNFTTGSLEISNSFQKLLRLHGGFTAATF